MKIETHYICEICGTHWLTEAFAKECEAFVLPPSKFKLGDEIDITVRYGPKETDEIVELNIVANEMFESLSAGEAQVEYMRRDGFHYWEATVRYEHQRGKDYFTDRVGV